MNAKELGIGIGTGMAIGAHVPVSFPVPIAVPEVLWFLAYLIVRWKICSKKSKNLLMLTQKLK